MSENPRDQEPQSLEEDEIKTVPSERLDPWNLPSGASSMTKPTELGDDFSDDW